MKKLFLVLAIGAVFAACNNETKTDNPATGDTTTTVAPPPPVESAPVKDSVMQYKGGKVQIMLGGSWSDLSAPVTTSNGRTVTPTGDVTKGKITRKMDEGMMIDKDGQMMDKDGKPMDTTGWE